MAILFHKYKYLIATLIAIAIVVIYKLSFLPLPYYWDEAFPYSTAVHTMYHHGISFSPAAVPPDISHGHPPMFFILGAAWMYLFGTSLIAGHSFALFVAALTAFTTFLFGSRFFSPRVGFIATLLFCSQAVFISQSAFLMPEMIMALFTLWAFYAYFAGKNLLFVIITAAMLLTKESGAVLIISLACVECYSFLTSKTYGIKNLLVKAAYIGAPVAIASLFFIAQKALYGWFLYPSHIGYISSRWTDFKQNLPGGIEYLLIYYGRNAFTLLIIIAVIYSYSKRHRNNASGNFRKIAPVFGCYIIFYLLFSSVNVFIPRYLLCIFPPFIIIGAALTERAFTSFRLLYPLAIAGICAACIYFYSIPLPGGDRNYAPSVKTDLAMVRHCELLGLQEKHIFTTSVLRLAFNDVYAGYVTGKPFTDIQWEFDKNTEYCIFSLDEYDASLFDKIKRENDLQLIKRFRDSYAWCELYKVVR